MHLFGLSTVVIHLGLRIDDGHFIACGRPVWETCRMAFGAIVKGVGAFSVGAVDQPLGAGRATVVNDARSFGAVSIPVLFNFL